MENESAVILPIPEVEPVVGPLRWQYDAAAKLGVPAHITLLYPFGPAQAASEAITTLRDVLASVDAFPFSFIDVRRFPATAYLHPDKVDTFVHITQTLVRAWPDRKPYAGAFPDVIPHLTVADRVQEETLIAVEDSLRPQLPIQCVAGEVWLMTSDEAGRWSKRACFPLQVSRGD